MAVPNGKMAVPIGSRLNQNDFNILFIMCVRYGIGE